MFTVRRTTFGVFSLTWPASMQIYWNKRKRLHKKRVQTPRARSIQQKFQPVRPGKVVHLKTRFFETFPVGPNQSIEFWTEISGNFG